MVNISQMYLSLDEPLGDNKNLKITNCYNCCKVFMPPPSYKGITPKFCHKCYKNNKQKNTETKINNSNNEVTNLNSILSNNNNTILSNNNNIISNNNSILSNNNTTLSNNSSTLSNNNSILINNNNSSSMIHNIYNNYQVSNNNFFSENNKFKELSLFFNRIIESLYLIIKLMLRCIPIRFSKNKVFEFFRKKQEIKNRLLRDRRFSDTKIRTKSKKRKERRYFLKKAYQDNFKKHQQKNKELQLNILKQNRYNQIQREILCDEVTNLRKDKIYDSILYNQINEKVKNITKLYVSEKEKNNIDCRLSISDLKKIVDQNYETQNSNNNINDIYGENVCTICLSNSKQLAFNCGHLCCCYSCGLRLLKYDNKNKKCPICRVKISSVFKIY